MTFEVGVVCDYCNTLHRVGDRMTEYRVRNADGSFGPPLHFPGDGSCRKDYIKGCALAPGQLVTRMRVRVPRLEATA